jgi:hypothetical protein
MAVGILIQNHQFKHMNPQLIQNSFPYRTLPVYVVFPIRYIPIPEYRYSGLLQHFWGNNSLKIKVHRSRLYCIHFTAVLTSKFPLYFRGKGIFREKNTIPANTGIDIFEIPVLYRPRYCIFNTELETLCTST